MYRLVVKVDRALYIMAAILVLTSVFSSVLANPKERIDYWRNNYVELSPDEDPRVARAHEIFDRVIHAAGRTLGVMPRLFILKRDPLNISLPIAIPDGWVIISKGTLDICYRDAVYGDDRLAFVLAHEVAHKLKGDFWHMQFFQALEASKSRGGEPREALAELGRAVQAADDIWAKELQADEHGVVYAAMAGFRTNAIVTEDGRVNFFQEWVTALDPQRIRSESHPAPQQRATAVKARLHHVMSKIDAFQVGLRFYQAGDYTRAIRAFEKFLEYFPSREVYYNLAASHHQLALQIRQLSQPRRHVLPFKLSLAVDPKTRARGINLRASKGPKARFDEHIEKAIEFYEVAKSLDPSYGLSYNNLGCAYIVKGEAFKAIAALQDALELSPGAPDVLNNLGVAFFAANLAESAKAHLYQARMLAPRYDAALFNLGKIAYEERHWAEARRHWQAYLRLDAMSPWAELLRRQDPKLQPSNRRAPAGQQPAEHVKGLAVAAFEDEIPTTWGRPRSVRRLQLEEEPLTVRDYRHGMMTFAQDEEIVMIVAEPGYRGKSSRGIAIGSAQAEVLDQYQTPSRVLEMTQGESWVYDKMGISFQMRHGRVVSWLLF